eukprot:GHVN01040999.1.p1 GENE.GHVN01040999.1~~GHVN01040999.1.p1  ORF type:complete len:934 (+),score=189.95 GHVN01040999.1:29-2830(+)
MGKSSDEEDIGQSRVGRRVVKSRFFNSDEDEGDDNASTSQLIKGESFSDEDVSSSKRRPRSSRKRSSQPTQTTTLSSLWGGKQSGQSSESSAKPEVKVEQETATVACDIDDFFSTAKKGPIKVPSQQDDDLSFDSKAPHVDWEKVRSATNRIKASQGEDVDQTEDALDSQCGTDVPQGSQVKRGKRSASEMIDETATRLRDESGPPEAIITDAISNEASETKTEDHQDDDEDRPQPKKRRLPSSVSGQSPPAITKKANRTSLTLTPKPKAKSSPAPSSSCGLPLEGIKIVFTGVTDQMSRDEIEAKAKSLGAHVMTGVSGKTNYLVTGSRLEDGRGIDEGSKHKKSTELISTGKGIIKIITEDEFIKMIDVVKQADRDLAGDDRVGIDAKSDGGDVAMASSPPPTSQSPRAHGPMSGGCQLWTEKYRPSGMDEIVGNHEQVKKLMNWLKDWKNVILKGEKKPVAFRGAVPDNVNARAALISGPPGIGKTSAASIVAKHLGMDVIEFNASDERGKKSIEVISDMSSGGLTLSAGSVKKNTVIVMDEVDGLAGGDRGGSPAIIKLIEHTKMPVVCICNDRANPKVRSIASKCYDLRFTRPTKGSIAKRMCEVGRCEGIIIEPNAIELLCENVGNDIRLIINTIQLMMSSGADRITYDTMRAELNGGSKDSQVMLNPFDVTKKLLSSSEASKLSMNDRLDGYFVDYDLIPLLMNENYLASEKGVTPQNADQLSRIQRVADDFVWADKLSRSVRKSNNWALLPDIGTFTCISPSVCLKGFLSRVEFAKWLGKNSTATKARRLLYELQLYLSPHTTTCSSAMRCSGFLDLLYQKSIKPLLDVVGEAKGAAEASISVMDEYGLRREHVTENLAYFRLEREEKLYDLVDSKTKATLTRLYNSTDHHIRIAPISLKAARSRNTSLASLGVSRGGGDGDVSE